MKFSDKIKASIILVIIVGSIYIYQKIPINLGLDLQGGTQIILEAQDTKKNPASNDAVQGALAVIRNRVDALGVSEPVIRRKGNRQIIVELPGVKNPERAIKLIGETALLEFIEAEWAPGDSSNLTPKQLRILAGDNARLHHYITYDNAGKEISKKPIILKQNSITGSLLKTASPATDSYGRPIVHIEFNDEGSKKFYEMTGRSVGRPIAILLDNTIISAPNVNEAIGGGKAQITGSFSIQEMRDLVIKLKAGSLPIPVEIISNKIVGPTLGQDSINKSKKAGMIGFGAIILFMLLIYRVSGSVASIALVVYLLICVALLKSLQATLTLPGIAGLILTLGMAVDANVIIFERIKEEKKQGLPINSAIANGFSLAFKTIVDANITTLIAAIVLFWLGTGTIKGFAVTLSIGILVSMFTAIIVTKLLIQVIAKLFPQKGTITFKG